MKISVIIPVYNVRKYLKEAVESVIHQSYTELEILLVDDGSTDGSEVLCDLYAKQDVRIKVIHQTNSGLSAARNIGIEHATGDYLFFLDSDDVISVNCLKDLYMGIEEYSADIVYSRHYKFQDGQNIPLFNQESADIFVVEKEDIMKRLMRVGPWCDESVIISCNKLFHRSLFENIKFPVGKIHEDEYVAHRLYQQASCIVYVDKITYFYRVRSGSIMNDQTFCLSHFLDSFEFGKERILFCKKYMPKLYSQSVRAYVDNIQIQFFQNDSKETHKIIKREVTRKIIKIQPEIWRTQTIKYYIKTIFFLISPKRWKKRYWG